MNLQGKVAVVAGAGGGIGAAVVETLANEGADLVCLDADEEAAKRSVERATKLGRVARCGSGDLSKSAVVERLVDDVCADSGRIDILVNCVGIGASHLVVDHDETVWDQVMAVNLKSAFLLCRRVLPEIVEAGGGRIVNVTSRAAYQSSAGTAAYAASKAGLLAFSRVLAVEAGPRGVTVNTVAPGTTLTPMTETFYGGPDDRAAHAKASGVVLAPHRFADPEEIAGAVAYLCSPAAEHVTGATLHVNGGSYMA